MSLNIGMIQGKRTCKMKKERLINRYKVLTLEEDHWDYRGKNNSERDFVHGFCTYPAMMVPKMQREMLDVYLEEIGTNKIWLLDPFVGSGTILVEGMLRGLNVVGIDINPLAILLCKAKTTIVLPQTLCQKSSDLLTKIFISQEVEEYKFDGITKWFTPQAIKALSIIRVKIMEEPSIELRRFFWATFCEVIRVVSNSRDCTYKLHIKTKEEIDAYDKDALEIFKSTLEYNIQRYLEFYDELKKHKLIKKDGITYKYSINIILGDSIEYLKECRKKYDVVFTSPPYGDNHTTVSYGQYSVLPIRWINCHDIDENVNMELLNTQCAIDKISLGGKRVIDKKYRERLQNKSEILRNQLNEIENKAANQVDKIVSFYFDMDAFLNILSKRLKKDSISVWTVGNRQVAKQEIYMNKIVIELGERYGLSLLTSFTRKITMKRMPETNAYSGDNKGLQVTMTREHILILGRGDLDDGRTNSTF